jgi:16S rRNA (adenine1518-N6/adenine1519-N6)-dimethyltransferase
VRIADLAADDVVVEVGPGLGSLTLGLLGAAARVVAVEIDPGARRPAPGDRCASGCPLPSIGWRS